MLDDLKDYIKLEDCKDGHLYKIESRNLSFGVYKEDSKGFSGIRTKFGNRFIFEEYHWDSDPTFGTVKPVKEICPCPIPSSDYYIRTKELFEWLEFEISELR
jgi:hypothetical protein